MNLSTGHVDRSNESYRRNADDFSPSIREDWFVYRIRDILTTLVHRSIPATVSKVDRTKKESNDLENDGL